MVCKIPPCGIATSECLCAQRYTIIASIIDEYFLSLRICTRQVNDLVEEKGLTMNWFGLCWLAELLAPYYLADVAPKYNYGTPDLLIAWSCPTFTGPMFYCTRICRHLFSCPAVPPPHWSTRYPCSCLLLACAWQFTIPFFQFENRRYVQAVFAHSLLLQALPQYPMQGFIQWLKVCMR